MSAAEKDDSSRADMQAASEKSRALHTERNPTDRGNFGKGRVSDATFYKWRAKYGDMEVSRWEANS